jgi:hypothetical protein
MIENKVQTSWAMVHTQKAIQVFAFAVNTAEPEPDPSEALALCEVNASKGSTEQVHVLWRYEKAGRECKTLPCLMPQESSAEANKLAMNRIRKY